MPLISCYRAASSTLAARGAHKEEVNSSFNSSTPPFVLQFNQRLSEHFGYPFPLSRPYLTPSHLYTTSIPFLFDLYQTRPALEHLAAEQ